MIEVGISGWTYAGWRGTFYPKKWPHHRELEFASQELPSIEINGTFYSLQRPTSYLNWYQMTPLDFIFSVKANRYITHVKKLNDVEIPMANFFASGILHLKEKLGPILWQLPPSLGFHPEKIQQFFRLLPKDFEAAKTLAKKNELSPDRTMTKIDFNFPLRHALEVRHDSFMNPWFIDLLKEYNVAVVFADTAGKWPYIEDITSDFIYVRLHGDTELYVSGYENENLNFWSKRILAWQEGLEVTNQLKISEEIAPKVRRDVFIYFDNDAKVRAPVDAKNLIKKVHGPGLAH